MEYSKQLETAINFLREIQQMHPYYTGLLEDKSKEVNDLEHELYLGKTPTNKTATKLKRTLKERRRYKDITEQLEPICTYLTEKPKLLDELGRVLGQVRKIERIHANRYYIPKVRNDLTIGRSEANVK